MNVVTSINRMRLSSLVRIVVVYVYIMQTVKDELFDLSVHVQFFVFVFFFSSDSPAEQLVPYGLDNAQKNDDY